MQRREDWSANTSVGWPDPRASPAGQSADSVWRLVEGRVTEVEELLGKVDRGALDRATKILLDAYRGDNCIFVAGNGGSAATASHWVNDLHKTSMRNTRGIRAISLADNVSLITAFANDEGYDSIFRQQLASHWRPGDILVLISVSGSSPNLVSAALAAQERGITTIGLLGWDGGLLGDIVTEAVIVPAPRGEYPAVENAHTVMCSAFCDALVA
jgi:D-sedoheptulose 7-phosphate isomerase